MITILNLNEYSMQLKCEQETLDEIQTYFHISKKKWNQHTITNNGPFYTIQFHIPETKDISENDIDVLYEDDFIIAVYKPPFLLVHDDGNTEDTLQARVNYYLEQNGWPYPCQAIHRIDYECSGIVICSKFPFFQGMFDHLIESHDCIKEYYAKVQGNMNFKKKTIQKPIARDRHNAKAMIIHKNGKEATSHVEVLKKDKNTTLCRVRIETGRKHQIRVHLSSIGHPIINDPIYGHRVNNNGLLLENFHMEFIHPITKDRINIEIECDKRFNI